MNTRLNTHTFVVITVSTACALMLASAGCETPRSSRPSPHEAAVDKAAGQPAAPDFESITKPYPHHAWRFASGEVLRKVALTTSHILIAHEQSLTEVLPLRDIGWNAERSVNRTEDNARKLAAEVAIQLATKPEAFAEMAAQYSDDLVTAGRGGSLGTRSAIRLPREFLDALGGMRVGEISRVIQTELGFHIVHWRPTPPAARVAGREIVIGHASAASYENRPGRTTTRARDAARDLAAALAKQATNDPSSFDALVATHSDHLSAERGGDIGVWSTHEDGLLSGELEALAKLKEGDITEPIETRVGFKVPSFRELGAGHAGQAFLNALLRASFGDFQDSAALQVVEQRCITMAFRDRLFIHAASTPCRTRGT